MPIICFFGSDGSGKSTAASLTEILSRDGFKVKMSWMRGTHTFAAVIARFFSKFSVFKGSDNPYYMISIPRIFRRVWQLLEFISIIPIILARYSLSSTLGYTVIAERYLPDFITWVTITTNDRSYPKSFAATFLLALASKSKVVVFVTADLAELKKRRASVYSLFIQKQLELYGELAKSLGAFKLDTTNKSVSESESVLLAVVSETLSHEEIRSSWHNDE